MVPRNCPFGFYAEFLDPSPAYDEYEKFLRQEFIRRPAGWEPRFGKVARYDRHLQAWNHSFILTGCVPEAGTEVVAARKVHELVRELGTAFRHAHANPGHTLPEPVIRVWEWADIGVEV